MIFHSFPYSVYFYTFIGYFSSPIYSFHLYSPDSVYIIKPSGKVVCIFSERKIASNWDSLWLNPRTSIFLFLLKCFKNLPSILKQDFPPFYGRMLKKQALKITIHEKQWDFTDCKAVGLPPQTQKSPTLNSDDGKWKCVKIGHWTVKER